MSGRSALAKGTAAASSAMLATCVMAGPAVATASSGLVFHENRYLNNGVWYGLCNEGVIADVADSRAFTFGRDDIANDCIGPRVAPAGYLGAQARGYRDGSFCGNTTTVYSGVDTDAFGVGAVICSNPSGSQSFKTIATGYWYVGPAYKTNNGYAVNGISSPFQSY